MQAMQEGTRALVGVLSPTGFAEITLRDLQIRSDWPKRTGSARRASRIPNGQGDRRPFHFPSSSRGGDPSSQPSRFSTVWR